MTMRRREQGPRFINTEQWLVLARERFADENAEGVDFNDSWDVCLYLSQTAIKAHWPPVNEIFLQRFYRFLRWSMIHVQNEALKSCLEMEIFRDLLHDPHAKSGCLDYLDLGDVKRFTIYWDDLTRLEDQDHFDRLYAIWEKRWSRNQKLPPPELE